MNNIFKNAYFGKAYKTRDGRKVIYHCMKNNTHWLIFEEGPMYYYQNDGLYDDIKHIPNDLDIVSEWHEEINKEELDKLAYTFANNNELLDSLHISDNADVDDLAIAYKVGFYSKIE